MASDTVTMLRAVGRGDSDSVFRTAAKAIREGFEDEALPVLDEARALNPGDARLWQLTGLAHHKRDELAEAVAAFGKATALAPHDPLMAHSSARCALEGGLPAVALFDRALALAPDDGTIHLGRIGALYAEGRIDLAIDDLAARLRRHPGWLAGHGSLSRLRWLNGDRERFAESFETAVAATPRDVALWREWADALLHADRFEAVLALVARARAAAGPHSAFDAIEAVTVAEQGDTARADRLFAALGEIAHPTMAVRYMRHLLRAGRPEAAAAFGEPWLAREGAELILPYMTLAWRLTGDARWEAVEGDERLVGVYDLADSLPPLDALAERLRGLHLAVGQPLEQSVRGGTQTDGPLLSRIEPEIRALRAAILGAVEQHIAQLPEPPARPGRVRFAGSWSVRLTGSGHHSNHLHPAGWLSSALYVALPDPMGAPPAGWLTLGAPQAELGLDLAPFRTIEPRPGRLVLFPSTMWHGTNPFSDGERLTVAFDVARPL